MLNTILQQSKEYLPDRLYTHIISFISREGLRRYSKNTSWMFLSRFILMGISFFIAVYLARYLGPEEYGLYNYVISFVGLFSFIAGLGIDAILGREILLYEEKKSQYLGTAFYIYLISSTAALFLVNGVSLFLEHDRYVQLLIFLFSTTMIFQVSGIFNVYFLSHVKAKELAFLQIGTATLSAFLKMCGFLINAPLIWFILLFVIDGLVYFFSALYVFKRLGGGVNIAYNHEMTKNLFLKSFPFMLSIVTTSIYMKIDQVMIRSMLGDAANGIYSVAVKLSEMWYFIPSLICASLFPAIVNAKKVSEKLYYKRVHFLIISMLITSFIFILPLSFFSEFIIDKLYGSLYQEASSSLRVYVLSSIPVFVMPVLAAYVTTENRGRRLLLSTVLGACVNVLLNIILIPVYGILGAAIATSISYMVPALYLYSLFSHHKSNLKYN